MITSPIVAANIAAVVSQPRIFIARVLTHLPMILRLLVMSMTINIRNGVETPCTIPEKIKAFMGLMPKKFSLIASNVKITMAP